MHKYVLFGLSLLTCLFSAVATNAGTVTYTDKTNWANALGGSYLTEDFNDAQLNPGVSLISSESGGINLTHGYYQDVLASQSSNEPNTIWSFETPIVAYGGSWTLGGPGGSGNNLLVYIADTASLVGSISNSYNGEFWGFISDTPFSSVKLIGGSGSNQQHYFLDDMVYSPVPEPSTACLLICALMSVLGWKLRISRR